MADSSFDAELHIETTTIMFADVVESVRLIEQDESANVSFIRAMLRDLSTQVVPKHAGKVLERRGDGLLVAFSDARSAALCALAIHEHSLAKNQSRIQRDFASLRIGIHSAEVLADESAIYGKGINVAARIGSLAGPGETVVSADVRDCLVAGVDVDVTDIGECFLKHVEGSIHAFRIGSVGAARESMGTLAKVVEEELPRVAVLPFRRATASPTSAAASDLICESLVHALASSERCRVTSWLSSRVAEHSAVDARSVGVKLCAQWLVTGSLYEQGDHIVIASELINVASEEVESTIRVSGLASDLLEAESEIVGELAHHVVQRVLESEAKRISKHALPTLQSHSILTGAIGLMHRSRRESFTKSREALEFLLERHPRMHAVRPWLAQWFVLRNTRGFSHDPDDDAKRAIEQTRRAIDALPSDALSLAMQGFVTFHIVKDLSEADRLIDESLAASPNNVFANIFASATKAALGDYETGWEYANRALQSSPFDPLRNYLRSIAASSAILAKRYETCFELSSKSVQENASHPAAWRTLAMSAALTGRLEQARTASRRLLQLVPNLTVEQYRRLSHLPSEQLEILAEALTEAGIPIR